MLSVLESYLSFSKKSKVEDRPIFKTEEIPTEIWTKIFEYFNMKDMQLFRLVCKNWQEILDSNSIWSVQAKKQWKEVKLNARIRNWRKFFIKRFEMEKAIYPVKGHPIENCVEFEFQCPLLIENLRSHPQNQGAAFCDQCKRTVYFVETQEELEKQVAHGNCVSFLESNVTPMNSFHNIVIVGDPGVGKSTFIRWIYQRNRETSHSTSATPFGDNCYQIYVPQLERNVSFYDINIDKSILDSYPEAVNNNNLHSNSEPNEPDFDGGDNENDVENHSYRNEVVEMMDTRKKHAEAILGVDPDYISAFFICFSLDDPDSFHSAINQWKKIVEWSGSQDAKVAFLGLKENLKKEKEDKFLGSMLYKYVSHSTANSQVNKLRGCKYFYFGDCSIDSYDWQFVNLLRFVQQGSRRLGGCAVV